MKILFLTLALDSMPFLPLIWAELRKLPKEIDWQWWIMEGVALPEHCTSWVSKQDERVSEDGTHEYLLSVSNFDERVIHQPRYSWNGKIAMVNEPLSWVNIPFMAEEDYAQFPKAKRSFSSDGDFLLWQMDSDEIWTAEQIAGCWDMFKLHPQKNSAFFWCRYFVGPDKVIITRDGFGNHPAYEWQRVWKIKPGMLFKTHEPPVIEGLKLNPFTHAETEARGLVFEHMAYATRAQVSFKETYYAGPNNPNAKYYKGLTERWEKFQQETVWPRSLKEVMPWVAQNCMVDKI